LTLFNNEDVVVDIVSILVNNEPVAVVKDEILSDVIIPPNV